MNTFDEREVPLRNLLLDPNNYRFRDEADFKEVKESRFKEDGVQGKAESRLHMPSLIELKNSIIQNGFLPIERLIVRPLIDSTTHYVVVEGNRRVAALRWIYSDYKAGVEIPDSLIAKLERLPVLLILDLDAEPGLYEAIMGIRHVSGIKEWGGYQRAKLISVLRDDKGLESTVVSEKLGMTNREVVRRYRAFKALQQMEFDDEFGQFATPHLYPLFHEAVSLPLLRDWLKWDENTTQFTNQGELRIFYSWLTPQEIDDENFDPKITSHREIRELPSILAHPDAVSVLKHPSSSFAKASAIANRGEAAKAWRAQVAGARDALLAISAVELGGLQQDDIDAIESLKNVVEKTLKSFLKLTAE